MPARMQSVARSDVRDLTRDLLVRVLEFKVAHDLNDYLRDVHGQQRYSDLEAELHLRYPITGVGVRAHRGNLTVVAAHDGGFLIDAQKLAPEDAVPLVDRFPIEAASASYLFALVETHGNDLAMAVARKLPTRGDWHSPVSAKLNLSVAADVRNAKGQLAANLGVPASRVSRQLVTQLATLKATRNAIVHEAKTRVDFDEFFARVVGLICRLHFVCVPSDTEIVMFPFLDRDDEFHPQHATRSGVYLRVP